MVNRVEWLSFMMQAGSLERWEKFPEPLRDTRLHCRMLDGYSLPRRTSDLWPVTQKCRACFGPAVAMVDVNDQLLSGDHRRLFPQGARSRGSRRTPKIAPTFPDHPRTQFLLGRSPPR